MVSVVRARDLFAQSARSWTRVAELVEVAGVTSDVEHLLEASQLLEEIAAVETEAMTVLRSLSRAPAQP